jgi:hypothetical protein
MFPDTEDFPSGRLEGGVVPPVSGNGRRQLVRPPLGVRLGPNRSMFGAAVPETAVQEDRQADASEHDVRFASTMRERS